jgi:hypothetical protein
MKKLLILMLVLGLTSVAGAALHISVNGNMNPIDSQYTLLPIGYSPLRRPVVV